MRRERLEHSYIGHCCNRFKLLHQCVQLASCLVRCQYSYAGSVALNGPDGVDKSNLQLAQGSVLLRQAFFGNAVDIGLESIHVSHGFDSQWLLAKRTEGIFRELRIATSHIGEAVRILARSFPERFPRIATKPIQRRVIACESTRRFCHLHRLIYCSACLLESLAERRLTALMQLHQPFTHCLKLGVAPFEFRELNTWL